MYAVRMLTEKEHAMLPVSRQMTNMTTIGVIALAKYLFLTRMMTTEMTSQKLLHPLN